jgi:ATP-binding cassette subfamily B protein
MAQNNFAFQEEKLPKKLNFSVWGKISKYAFACWPILLILLLTMSITSFYDASFVPSLTKASIDAVNENVGITSDISNIVFHVQFIFNIRVDMSFPVYISVFLIGMLLRSIAIFFTFFLTNYVSMVIMTSLRRDSFKKIQSLSFAYFDRTPSGWLIARLQNDTSDIGEVLSWSMNNIAWSIFEISFTLLTMFTYNWQLSLVILASVPLLIIIVPLFEKALLKGHRIARNAYSNFVRWLAETIDGAKTIKTLAIEDEVYKEADEVITDIKTKRFKAHKINGFFQPLINLIASFTTAGIILMGINLINANPGDITMVSTIVLFIGFVGSIYNPIQNLSEIFSDFMATQASAEKVLSLLNTKPDIVDSEEVIAKYGTIFDNKKENFEPLTGDIIYKNVSFNYQNGQEVIHNINLTIKEGSNVALVGETGGGKTTTVNLLCRFYEPTSGEIIINNEDYRKHSLSWLHCNIGYVQQTPFVFTGTFRDNIAYGKLNATQEEIENAAKIVGIHDFIKNQKDGYDTYLKDGGSTLSLGQKQLISFARAIIRNPKILILDEATSSIDTETENILQNATKTLLKGRTSLIIAHRLSTIVNCDRILVIKDGRIIEDGNHKELMEKKGYYHELYMNQFKELNIEQQIDTYEKTIEDMKVKL